MQVPLLTLEENISQVKHDKRKCGDGGGAGHTGERNAEPDWEVFLRTRLSSSYYYYYYYWHSSSSSFHFSGGRSV